MLLLIETALLVPYRCGGGVNDTGGWIPLREYRGTSLIRKRTPLGPCSRPMPRVFGGSYGGGRFLTCKVPLYSSHRTNTVELGCRNRYQIIVKLSS